LLLALCAARSQSNSEWKTRARDDVLAELQRARETNAASGGKAGVGAEFNSPSTGRSAISRGSESDTIVSSGAHVGSGAERPMLKPRPVPVPAVPDMDGKLDSDDDSSDSGTAPEWTTAGVAAGATFAAGLGQQREKRGSPINDEGSSSSDAAVWDGDGNDARRISGSGQRRRSRSGSRSRSNSRGRITPRRAAAARASRRAATAGSPQVDLPGPPAPIAGTEEAKTEIEKADIPAALVVPDAAGERGVSPGASSEASAEQMSPVGTPEFEDGESPTSAGGTTAMDVEEEEEVGAELEAEVAAAPVPAPLDAPIVIRGSAGPGHPGAPARIGGTPSAGAAAVTAERAEGGGGALPPPPPPLIQ